MQKIIDLYLGVNCYQLRSEAQAEKIVAAETELQYWPKRALPVDGFCCVAAQQEVAPQLVDCLHIRHFGKELRQQVQLSYSVDVEVVMV